MQKVNWKAKFDYEFIGNFKVFQNTLEKLGIVRKIEVKDLCDFRLKSLQKLSIKITSNWYSGSSDTFSWMELLPQTIIPNKEDTMLNFIWFLKKRKS